MPRCNEICPLCLAQLEPGEFFAGGGSRPNHRSITIDSYGSHYSLGQDLYDERKDQEHNDLFKNPEGNFNQTACREVIDLHTHTTQKNSLRLQR